MRSYGVDGCRDGWFFFGLGEGKAEFGVVGLLEKLLERVEGESPVFIDIPIGLPHADLAVRACDQEARKALKPYRSSSVFPVPSREAVYADDYSQGARLNREALGKGLPKQSWAITPKIREIDQLLIRRPELRCIVRECHPEVCFWGLAGGPMVHPKKTRAGFDERLAVLSSHLAEASELFKDAFVSHGCFEVQRDDIIDALANALCASHGRECATLPTDPEIDQEGLTMEMVYWDPNGT